MEPLNPHKITISIIHFSSLAINNRKYQLISWLKINLNFKGSKLNFSFITDVDYKIFKNRILIKVIGNRILTSILVYLILILSITLKKKISTLQTQTKEKIGLHQVIYLPSKVLITYIQIGRRSKNQVLRSPTS